MDDLSQRIANLSPQKRALLDRRLMNRSVPVTNEQTISRRGMAGPCPLSFAQERLWFLNQLEPDSPAYNMHMAVRMRGALNMEALQKTLDAIVARHEVLRTTFAVVDGIPVQVIAENPSVELPVIALSERPGAEREAEAQRLLLEKSQYPFDLSHDLMLRAAVLRLAEEEHVLCLTMHHIASDAWSMGILMREMAAFYEAFSGGQPAPLAGLPIQYADFAVVLWNPGPWAERRPSPLQSG
jgi:hypothetical protein